jgi:hypothetical protein
MIGAKNLETLCLSWFRPGPYGVQLREVGGRLDGPRHDLVIMVCPVPEQWQLRG